MGTLKCRWLGSPLIEYKGRDVKLETRKAAAPLAYISLTPGECQREVLATMLWQDDRNSKPLCIGIAGIKDNTSIRSVCESVVGNWHPWDKWFVLVAASHLTGP